MFKILRKKVGIIGYGNMGSAITKRIRNKYRVSVFDKDKDKTKNLTDVMVAGSIADLIEQSDVVILAVKPQDFDTVLNEIKSIVNDELIISIAAGIATVDIERFLGEVKVIRVMPNLPARIGKGTNCICKGKFATDEDLKFVLKLFKLLGITFILNEDMMDAATAVSGSGPGFWCNGVEGLPRDKWREFSERKFIPEFVIAAESVNFDKKTARLLAENTARGSLATVEAWHIEPAELKKQVASPGGTTEAGLEVLHKGGSLTEAVKAAVKRAKELSRG